MQKVVKYVMAIGNGHRVIHNQPAKRALGVLAEIMASREIAAPDGVGGWTAVSYISPPVP